MWYNSLLARGLIPDWILRRGVQSQGKQRLQMMSNADLRQEYQSFLKEASSGEIAVHTDDANNQHYEVDSEFFQYSLGKNLITLAGDTHNAWGGQLKDGKGNVCGYEFAASSVSSPGLEYYLQLPEPMALQFAEALKLLIDDLDYANIHQRGFMTVTFTAEKAHSEWHLLSSVHQSDYQMISQSSEVLAK